MRTLVETGEQLKADPSVRAVVPVFGGDRFDIEPVVRTTEQEARQELARITTVKPDSPGFANFGDWTTNTQLERPLALGLVAPGHPHDQARRLGGEAELRVLLRG